MHFAQKNGFWKTCRIMSKSRPQYIEIKFVEMWITYVEMWITCPKMWITHPNLSVFAQKSGVLKKFIFNQKQQKTAY